MAAVLSKYLPDIIAYLTPVLTGVGAYLIKLILNWIHAHTKAGLTQTILIKVSDIIETVVRELMEIVVTDAKAASIDGKLTPEEIRKIRDDALAKVKAFLGPDGLKEIMGILGITPSTIDSYLTSKINSTVQQVKIEQYGTAVDKLNAAAN
jgi:hypothetical protein